MCRRLAQLSRRASIHVCAPLCACALAGEKNVKKKHYCVAQTTGASFSPIHHNKEQLNAAALPAEEPTAGRTSTNRQICIKPKGRSNKGQPTGSDTPPTQCSDDLNQKVTGCLASPYHSLPGVFKLCCLTCKRSVAAMCHYIWPHARSSIHPFSVK